VTVDDLLAMLRAALDADQASAMDRARIETARRARD
jgi:hypothetical protein